MGAGASSSLLTEKQVQKYVKETGFSPPELEFLFRRFRFLCKNSNTLGANDLSSNPNLAANPYVKRIFAVMPKDGYGQVTFDTFVKTAAIFRPGKPVVEKLKFIFDLFDYNLDDTLDVSELHQILSLVIPSSCCRILFVADRRSLEGSSRYECGRAGSFDQDYGSCFVPV